MLHRQQSKSRTIERERLAFLICREWQAAGKQWTNAELDAAIDARLNPVQIQRTLFDRGDLERITRCESFKDSQPAAERLEVAALRLLSEAGRKGLTRYELAKAMGVQQSSICSTVLALIDSRQVVTLKRKRVSEVGGVGAVIVATQFAEGQQ